MGGKRASGLAVILAAATVLLAAVAAAVPAHAADPGAPPTRSLLIVTTERIRSVAQRVAKWARAGHQMVVVPSAMSGAAAIQNAPVPGPIKPS